MPEPELGIEIEAAAPERTRAFWRAGEREALSAFYGFTVVWHEQSHEFAATCRGRVIGALRLRVAASLAHVEALAVAPEFRRRGIGRRLLTRGEEAASYYNCHKMTLLVPTRSASLGFFQACEYHVEAVLPQHTFKIDMAVVRKFLL
jgi:ribosomal protein S18 acetylase RimI-like enzyme